MAKAEAARGKGGGEEGDLPQKSDAWTDLGLTLPIFVLYHLGVVFLPIRNAADPVTHELISKSSRIALTAPLITAVSKPKRNPPRAATEASWIALPRT